MMLKRIDALLLVLVTLGMLTTARATARQANVAETRFQAALTKEVVEGKADQAIPLYQLVLATPGVSRATAAKALLQLGGCFEKLGRSEARSTYERLVKEHPGDPNAAIAGERLARMTTANGPVERLITTDRTIGGLGGTRWSPDGRLVIGMPLTSSEIDGHGLYLKNIETGNGRMVFSRAPGFGPGFWNFSPDGRRFAAMLREATPQGVMARVIRGEIDAASIPERGVLVVGNVDSAGPPSVIEIPAIAGINPFEPLTNPLAWSPDGKWLAYAMPVSPLPTWEIKVLNVATAEQRSLEFRAKGSIDLQWSPTGAEVLVHVAAAAGTPGELRIITVATAQGRPLPLPGAPDARLRVVRWSTKDEIAIRHINPATPQIEDTFLVTAQTGSSRKTCSGQAINLAGTGGVPNATGDICREITQDGTRQIVWQLATKRLVVRDLSTGVDRPLTTASGEEYYGTLSPDDRREVFLSNRDGRWGLYTAEIEAAPVSRPQRIAVFDDLPTSFGLDRWTPDGFVAYVVRNESNIVRVNVDPASGKAAGTERLTQDGILNHTPAISPDGQRIIYWSQHGSRFGVAVMDSNGANERLLVETPEDFPGLRPSWRSTSEILFSTLPSSATLAADRSGTPAVRRLMSLNTNTGGVSPIGELAEVQVPQFQARPQYVPASGEIVYVSSDYRSLRARSVVDGRTRSIGTFEGTSEVASFLVSPDGKKVAYVLAQRYSNGRACFSKEPTPVTTVEAMQTTCEFGVLDVATGARSSLPRMKNPQALVAWSPDGRFLIYGNPRPLVIDTTNGTSWPLLDPRVALTWNRTASWSPDGSFIVLADETPRWEWREWHGVR